MLTEKDYCDYDTCVALKKLGFPQDYISARYAKVNKLVDYTFHKKGDLIISEDRFVFTLGSESIVAPLLYEAQKWLREEKKIEVNAFYENPVAVWRFYILEIDSPDLSGIHAYNDAYMSYEEALLEGIKGAIKILKEE